MQERSKINRFYNLFTFEMEVCTLKISRRGAAEMLRDWQTPKGIPLGAQQVGRQGDSYTALVLTCFASSSEAVHVAFQMVGQPRWLQLQTCAVFHSWSITDGTTPTFRSRFDWSRHSI